MGKNAETLDNKCPHCGAKIDFDPKSQSFKCNYCGGLVSVDEMKKHETAVNSKNNVDEAVVDEYNEYFSYTCKDCGAEVITDEETVATFCVYCGNSAILKNKLSGKFRPDFIIPFKKDIKEATKCFIDLGKGRPLVPKAFTSDKNIEKIRGIYIPFWLHDFTTSGNITLEGRKYDHWSVGNTDYTKTSIYNVERGGSVNIKYLPTDGSTRFDDALMNTIQPYNYDEMICYNHGYLAGFLAERYDTDIESIKKIAEDYALDESKNQLLKSTSLYSSVNIKSNTLSVKDYSNKYVLLPVYMVNVKYSGKMYTFAMNGQTGKFIGDIPIDKKKAVFYSILTFIVSFLVVWLITYIMFKLGGGS